jgi:hypothetical protein
MRGTGLRQPDTPSDIPGSIRHVIDTSSDTSSEEQRRRRAWSDSPVRKVSRGRGYLVISVYGSDTCLVLHHLVPCATNLSTMSSLSMIAFVMTEE